MSTPMEQLIERAQARPDADGVISAGGAPQGSAAWLFAKVKHTSASRFEDVIGRQKNGKPYAARETYLWEKVVEFLTGNPLDHFTSAATTWGEEQEQFSAMDHEAQTGEILEPCEFVKHPTIKWVGCSPDRLIGEDGGWESKSPYNSGVHLKTYRAGIIPDEHIAQVQGCMWVTGRKWWWFKSYDSRLPAPVCRFVQRIERDDAYIARLEAEVIVFNAEVQTRVQEILAKVQT